VTDPATFEAQPINERPLPEFISCPPTLLDPKTARSVRVLCWTVCVILWLWLIISIVATVGFILGVGGLT
jgi:hypothetical protein